MRQLKSKISVIIPTLNSWATLRECISSINKQTLKPREIIVVDNACSDGTSSKIRKNFPWVKLVTLKRNIGVTGGRNKGISIANKNSRYLLFIDHDMVADKNMLLNLISVAETDSSYGIITPKIYYWEDKQGSPFSSEKRKKRIWAAGTNINLWTGQVLFRGGQDLGQFDNMVEVQVAPAVLMVKRQVVDHIGGFDDRYFLTYEDTDFCFRARAKGYKTIYAPYAHAYHRLSPLKSDDRKRLLKRAYFVARNRVLFMKDFGKNFYFFLLFSQVYLVYFGIMSFIERDRRGFTDYLQGYFSGITKVLKSK